MDGNERVLVTAANGSLYMPRHPRLLEMMSRRFHGRVTLERTKPELPRFVIAIVEPGKRGGNEFLDPQPRINTPNIIVKADGQIGDRWGKRIRGIKGDFAGTVNWLPRRNRRSGLPVVRTGVVQSDKEDGVITVGDIVEIG